MQVNKTSGDLKKSVKSKSTTDIEASAKNGKNSQLIKTLSKNTKKNNPSQNAASVDEPVFNPSTVPENSTTSIKQQSLEITDPPKRLTKREQLSLALREGKLKSVMSKQSTNSKSLHKGQNFTETAENKDSKLFSDNTTKKKMAPVYTKYKPSPRKVLKTRKSISDVYDISTDGLTPGSKKLSRKKAKPKSKPKAKSKKIGKANKFTLLTTDPNFGEGFPATFTTNSFYGVSKITLNKPDKLTPTEDIGDNYDDPLPYDDVLDDNNAVENVQSDLSDNHVFLPPSNNSSTSLRSFNSSGNSSKATPSGSRVKPNYLATSTPFSNNTNRMEISAPASFINVSHVKNTDNTNDKVDIAKLPQKTLAEDIANCFGFEEDSVGSDREMNQILSLPILKKVKNILSSTGNEVMDCQNADTQQRKMGLNGGSNWDISKIPDASLREIKVNQKQSTPIVPKICIEDHNPLNESALFVDVIEETKEDDLPKTKQTKLPFKKKLCSDVPVASPEKSFNQVRIPYNSYLIVT